MTKAVWGAGVRLAGTVILVLASASCGDVTRQGQSSSYLILVSLQGASGAEPDEFGNVLYSDVLTVVDDVPSIFSDSGSVLFQLGLKDPGPPTSPSTPTPNNYITLTQYSVKFFRTDGRNTEGVDVPYAFSGAITQTIVTGDNTAGFTLVRHQAKAEAPLRALVSNGIILSTIAEVTFYGHDQTGRKVSATGRIDVNFGNFGDPE